jgi:hypothetical protein
LEKQFQFRQSPQCIRTSASCITNGQIHNDHNILPETLLAVIAGNTQDHNKTTQSDEIHAVYPTECRDITGASGSADVDNE